MQVVTGKHRKVAALTFGFAVLFFSLQLSPQVQLESSPATAKFIQAQASETTGTQLSVQLPASVGSGDLLAGMFRTASGTSVSDNLNGPWTEAGTSGVNSLWYRENAKPGATTVTVTGSGSGPVRADVAEYTGVQPANALASANCSGAASSSNLATTGSTDPVLAGRLDFIGVGAFTNPIRVTAGSSSGVAATLRNQLTGSAGTEAIEDVMPAAAGPQNGTFKLSASADWAACLAAFRPATAVTATPSSTPTATPRNSSTPTPSTTPTPSPTALVTPVPTATPSPTPATPACTVTLAPGANIAAAEGNAVAGSVLCLKGGTYNVGDLTLNSSNGRAGAPITITSADRTNPATLNGRFVTDGSANYLNISHLKFTWQSSTADTVVLDTDHVNFTYNDVSGNDQTICLNPGDWDGAAFTNGLIDHNLVHDCGDPTNSSDQIHAQGIYIFGTANNNVISNNWCWNVAARCYQIRGGSNTVWRNNVADQANWGFIYGDLTPTNNNAYDNIVGPDVEHLGPPPGGYYSYGGSVVVGEDQGGSGNSFHDSCIPSAPLLQGYQQVSFYNNTIVNVQFVDATHHNYNLTSASINNPCRNYGVEGGNPGP